MKKLALALALITLAGCNQHKEPPPAFVATRDIIAAPARMSSLPPGVRASLESLCSNCQFADAGATMNASDVAADDTPQRVLTKVQRFGSEWIIQYNHGGMGTHNHTLVFALTPDVHLVTGSSCVPTSVKTCEW